MSDGDPRGAADLPSPATAWMTLACGAGWLGALPQLWMALSPAPDSPWGAARFARLGLFAITVTTVGAVLSGGAIAWGVAVYASLLATAFLLGRWFVGLTRGDSPLRRKTQVYSAAWLGLVCSFPALAWVELGATGQMGLYVIPIGLMAAPLMAWTSLHGRRIAAAAPLADPTVVRAWAVRRGLKARGATWRGEGFTLRVTVDDTCSPTRTTLWAEPDHGLHALSVRRGTDTRLNDVVLNQCLESTGDPAVAATVLAGHHEDFLPALHGADFRIEAGVVHATVDGNPSWRLLDAAWKLVLALEARGREVR